MAKKKTSNHRIYGFLIATLVLLLVIGVSYYNTSKFMSMNYYLDVGSVDEKSSLSALNPSNRVSSKEALYLDGELVTYRSLLSSLVYTSVPVPTHFSSLDVTVTFRDDFPLHGTFFIGAKNGHNWDYSWSKIYDKDLNLSSYNLTVDDGLYYYSRGNSSLIGVDNSVLTSLKNLDYSVGSFELNSTIRGGFKLLIYGYKSISGFFTKSDLNWYNGYDNYTITLKDFSGSVIGTYNVSDLGVNDTSHLTEESNHSFSFDGLDLGLYYLEFSNVGSDSSLYNLKINQEKVDFVGNVHFLEPVSVYLSEGRYNFVTWHNDAKQNLKINNETISIYSVKVDYPYFGSGELVIPKGDIIIQTSSLFSLEKNLFNPFEYETVDIDSLNKSNLPVDNVVLNYFVEGDEWKTATVRIYNDNLFYDDSLSLILKATHLDTNANLTIPVSSISVKFND
ncbi:hypothetical protein JXM83_02665 [Candidatus Woesearchaeota archaeon]|nr:hypothetical protein [Candidatus Woesearchaeota archaeon]